MLLRVLDAQQPEARGPGLSHVHFTAQLHTTGVSVDVLAVVALAGVLHAGWNAAIKTGLLFSGAIIAEVADALRGHRSTPLIIDPVMVATSGAALPPT